MNESSVFLLLPGLVLGKIQDSGILAQESGKCSLSVHIPELQLQAAASPLSRAPNPPAEEMGIRGTGERQPANLASARTLPPNRNFLTTH